MCIRDSAKRAWKLYINTGGGGIDNFKHYLRQNIVTNCPVTNNDINRAQKIFMHDVGHLKGSTTRKTPKRVREEEIEIPRELIHQSDDLTLFLDLFLCQWFAHDDNNRRSYPQSEPRMFKKS